MVRALTRLGGLPPGALPQSLNAFGINSGDSGWWALFATHPPVEARIAALRGVQS
jgi:heat shock protein HtpX